MKRKLKLTEFSVSSFETSLKQSEAETIVGGTDPVVSLLVISALAVSLDMCRDAGTRLVPDRAPNDNDVKKTQIHCTNLQGCTRMACNAHTRLGCTVQCGNNG